MGLIFGVVNGYLFKICFYCSNLVVNLFFFFWIVIFSFSDLVVIGNFVIVLNVNKGCVGMSYL